MNLKNAEKDAEIRNAIRMR